MKDTQLIELFIWSVALMVLVLIAGVCQVSQADPVFVICGPEDCYNE